MTPSPISSYDLDFHRLPFIKPFGFKGGSFREKWLLQTTLTDASGNQVTTQAGTAVLWSAPEVFAAHSETGGNLLMACILEKALQASVGQSCDDPRSFFRQAAQNIAPFARTLTGQRELSSTFIHNALVGLDNALWLLRAKQQGIDDFDALLPEDIRPLLSERQPRLALVPLISYGLDEAAIAALAKAACPVLKIKLGAAGSIAEMIHKDSDRIQQIHSIVRHYDTPETTDGRIKYYLDANGRYPDRKALDQLIDTLAANSILDDVILLEEPFPEEVSADVADIPTCMVADESAHGVESIRRRAAEGYRAIALKPAGKSLSLTLDMLATAHELGLHCFVADSACPPRLLDWNRAVAARLPRLPGIKVSLMESNGAQHYRDWQQLLNDHPDAHQPWLNPSSPIVELPPEYFRSGLPR